MKRMNHAKKCKRHLCLYPTSSPPKGRYPTCEDDYMRAVNAANILAEHLGKGWKPCIWQNLGWHSSAISKCGRWKVHPSVKNGKVCGYTAFLGDPDSPGGRWADNGRTPEAAMARVRKQALAELKYILQLTQDA